MLDYIWHRIKAIRNEKVIDFLDHFTPIESFDITPFEGNSELIQIDAKVRKNNKSSEVKQGTYRHGEEDQ
jgi:hypothetical protein